MPSKICAVPKRILFCPKQPYEPLKMSQAREANGVCYNRASFAHAKEACFRIQVHNMSEKWPKKGTKMPENLPSLGCAAPEAKLGRILAQNPNPRAASPATNPHLLRFPPRKTAQTQVPVSTWLEQVACMCPTSLGPKCVEWGQEEVKNDIFQ